MVILEEWVEKEEYAEADKLNFRDSGVGFRVEGFG